MDIQENIVNKVAQSGLVTLDPAAYYPPGDRVVYDIKDNLFQGLILREKDFREFVKEHDWAQYQDKNVAITCSADAIVPAWAYMLLANRMAPYAREVVFGDAMVLETVLFEKSMKNIDLEQYRDQRVVIKGCGGNRGSGIGLRGINQTFDADCKKPDVWRTLLNRSNL